MTSPVRPTELCAQAALHRDEFIYPTLFGRDRGGFYLNSPEMFTQTYGQAECDPAWLQCGVYEFAPHATRASWLYVTSGLSNAWDAGQDESEKPAGLGCEFVLELPYQAVWAPTRLSYVMAYQILVGAGRISGQTLLKDYDVIPLNTSIGTEKSALTCLLLAPPTGFARRVQLRTGWFDFVQAVGISDSEARAGQVHGGANLYAGLLREGAFPVTIPEREAIG